MFNEQNRRELSPERINEIDATRRVWHNRMRVWIPRYALHTPEFIKERGIPFNTAMPIEDRDKWNKEMILVYMSINRQVQLYEAGVPIAYPNRMKAVAAYMDIKQHVRNWKLLLSGSMNRRSKAPPMEDFDLLLEFAENLEQYLDYYYDKVDSTDLHAFKRQTMNRFVSNDKHIYREGSTYSNLRDGVYSVHTDRIARIDDRPHDSDYSTQTTHHQPVVEFNEDDALDAIRTLRN